MGFFSKISDTFGNIFDSIGIDNYVDSISSIASAIAEGDLDKALKEAAVLVVTAMVDYYTGGQFGEAAGAIFESTLEGKSLEEIGSESLGILVEDVVSKYAGETVGKMAAKTVTNLMEGQNLKDALVNTGSDTVRDYIEQQVGSDEFGKIASESLVASAERRHVYQISPW